MSRAALLRHLGSRLAHVTARENLPGIAAHGLLPAAELARRAGRDPGGIVLRDKRELLETKAGHPARLNHQLPILHGFQAANRVIEGHDAKSWAHVLDARVFFWPARRANGRFRDSVARDLETEVLWLDTAQLLEAAGDRLDLSPINSGNFSRAPSRRGDWLFVPVTDGLDAFRQNRRRRSLVKAPDSVAEVSLRGPLDPETLSACRV